MQVEGPVEWITAALVAVGGAILGAWRATVMVARRSGTLEQVMARQGTDLADHEERLRQLERNTFTVDQASEMEKRMLRAMHTDNATIREEYRELAKELRAIHSRLDRLNVPPSHGNGG